MQAVVYSWHISAAPGSPTPEQRAAFERQHNPGSSSSNAATGRVAPRRRLRPRLIERRVRLAKPAGFSVPIPLVWPPDGRGPIGSDTSRPVRALGA